MTFPNLWIDIPKIGLRKDRSLILHFVRDAGFSLFVVFLLYLYGFSSPFTIAPYIAFLFSYGFEWKDPLWGIGDNFVSILAGQSVYGLAVYLSPLEYSFISLKVTLTLYILAVIFLIILNLIRGTLDWR